MPKTRIAIACQGGGAETAFTAGALNALFACGIQDEFDIVSLGGTSGGAVCAALVWYALQAGDQPATKRLMEFWTESNRPQTLQEKLFNRWIVEYSRLVGRGEMPAVASSPYSSIGRNLYEIATYGQRKTFSDFKTALQAHIDFDRIREWGPLRKTPVLVVGAAGVLSGKLRKFVSRKEVIQVEHLLASCAVPHIFPAVRIGEDAYWDGLFADNPPIAALMRPVYVGEGNIPDEIWLIKIESTTRLGLPTMPDDITDRRKQMEGNVALINQLKSMEVMNDLHLWGGLTPEVRDYLQWHKPVCIPKIFADEPDKPYHIPHMEISPALYQKLDWQAKLDRDGENLDALMEDGQRSARKFLKARKLAVERREDPAAQQSRMRTLHAEMMRS